MSPWSVHSRTASTFSSKSLPPGLVHLESSHSRHEFVDVDNGTKIGEEMKLFASVSATSMYLNWTPPLADGGAVITRYRISWADAYRRGGDGEYFLIYEMILLNTSLVY